MGLADVVRLFAIPIFGLIAYRDVKFRRVPKRVWYPLVGLGVLTLGYDLFQLQNAPASLQRVLLLEIGIGIGFLFLIALILHLIDVVDVTLARALAVIGLLYPLIPDDPMFGMDLPLVRPSHGVLSFTVLSNAALISLLYPIGYAIWNGIHGDFAPVMFAGRQVERERVPDRHGQLLQTADGYTHRGTDLEAVKAYLRWREITVSLIAREPHAFGDPNYRPNEADREESAEQSFTEDPSDPWAADRFLEDGEYIGELTAHELRDALDVVAEEEEVWVSANFPFAVPIFVGLVIGVSVGDIATGLIQLVG